MTIQGRWAAPAIAAATLLLAGFLVFAGYGWLRERDARLQAETQSGQQQRQIDGLKQQQASVQLALKSRLATLEEERKAPATASQLVTDAKAVLPNLPEALRIETVPADPALPDGPAIRSIVVPEADFKSIRNAQLTCEENAARLAACETSGEESAQELKLTEAQRDSWKTAAKGGSVWRRTLGAAKWFAIGAGTGAVAYAVARHK